jgi:tRNA threonylcarbamoyladenosine biosynthesis protein TsaE
VSTGPQITEEVGAAVAALLPDGATVHLRGEIGAGKSTLVRGAARALGVEGPVTSPTFEIVRRYAGRRELTHVDAYRLATPDEEDLGLIGASAASHGLTFIEWPGGAASDLPAPSVEIELGHLAPERRLVVLRAEGPVLRAALADTVADIRARHRLPEPEPGGPRRG